MHQMIRLAIAVVLAVAFACPSAIATAQPVKQIKLTDKHVKDVDDVVKAKEQELMAV